MSQERFKQTLFGIITALLFVTITVPAYAVQEFKVSKHGAGVQIWFEAENFDERNPDTDAGFALTDEPGAFGRSITNTSGDDGAYLLRYDFDISKTGATGGTWYFWGRVINANNRSSFMLVAGHPGDPIPSTLPVTGLVNGQRIFEENIGSTWTWARTNHGEAHTKTLRDGLNTMYILAREDQGIMDTFMWTNDTSYVPTDQDYQDAIPGGGYGPALNPDPADGAIVSTTWVSATWRPGDFAVTHNIYFSENFADVNSAAQAAFLGSQPQNSFVVGLAGYAYPDGLVPGTTYYWRVDEVNDADPNSPWKGPVWSFFIPPKKAYQPIPADGAQYVDTAPTLSWTAGLGTKLHYVYFGDSFDTVNNATTGVPQITTSFTPTGPLAKGQTYYWRVDEFEGPATHKGDIWSFTTLSDIAVGDPSLLNWWKLDEGQGVTAVDWSGHNNHGRIEGNVKWTDGYDGGALEFDGSVARVIDDNGGDFLNGLNALTIAVWIKSDLIGTDKGFIEGQLPSGNDSFCTIRYDAAGASFGGANVMKMAVTSDPGGGQATVEQQLESSANIQTTEWQHVVMTWQSGGLIRLYVNGIEDMPTGRNNPNNAGVVAGCTAFIIGQGGKDAGGSWDGLIDDVRVYNKALTADEVKQIMRGDPLRAWNPSPDNRSVVDIDRARQPLTWSRGDKASQHDVYFGLDKDAVAGADASDASGIYRGRQSTASYSPAEGLAWGGGPYYWRIDEVNNDGTITAGQVWSFSVANYLIVDDIESYNDLAETDPGSNRIYTKWIDGFGTTTNGALVGNLDVPLTERSNTHSGAQAMPLSYDNNLKFSEATLTLTTGKDWTREGVNALSLWFRGATANAAEKMYVVLNGTAVVYNNDTTLTQKTAWTEWVIPLQDFATQGVNLTNVTSITIGFGTRGSTTTAGGTGQMYFDDIRLVRSATP